MFEKEGFGIKCEHTARETPQQNGMLEHAFANLFGSVRVFMTNVRFEKVTKEIL
jgi:hypothetical protein